jgi:uncharacterized delta-60 repeat protein
MNGRTLRQAVPAVVFAALAALFVTGARAAGGALDPSFGTGGVVLSDFGNGGDQAYAEAIQPDSKIVAAGVSDANGGPDFALARYTHTGALDPGFGTGGTQLTDFSGDDDYAWAVALALNGKVVAAGDTSFNATDYDFAVARYTKAGLPDPSFGPGGKRTLDVGALSEDHAYAVAVQNDGRIVAGGESDANGDPDFALVRYRPTGSLDTTFGNGGIVLTGIATGSSDQVQALAIQKDGKILAAGFTDGPGGDDFALVRYKHDGTLDQSFGTGGEVTTDFGSTADFATSIALLKDGRIVVAGYTHRGTSYDFAVARYTSSGALDPTFGSGGKVTTDLDASSDDSAYGVVIQSDGKTVVAGTVAYPGGPTNYYDFAVVRYTTGGALDQTYGTGGIVRSDLGGNHPRQDIGRAIVIQKDDNVVVAGSSSDTSFLDDQFALARYTK